MSSVDQLSVARIVRRSANLLAESLWDYWPSNGTNEIPERNISLHLGVALHQSGYRLFGEVHPKGSTESRLDFLAFNPEIRVTVLAECKRLYEAQQCGSMIEDLDRLRKFVPREEYLESKSFGVLAGTTWNEKIAKWWSTADAPAPTAHENWTTLRSHLDATKAHRGSIVLQTYDENSRVADHIFHHFVYAVFERRTQRR